MRYMMMVYEAERTGPPTESEIAEMIADYGAFHGEIAHRGNLITAERLHPISTSTTVRVRDGKQLITDGPFAETKETLGGVYVFECRDLDDALDLASKIPTAKSGSIEVRPVNLGEQEAAGA